jgi:hypothetical protein
LAAAGVSAIVTAATVSVVIAATVRRGGRAMTTPARLRPRRNNDHGIR